jgi:transposase
MFFPEGGLRVFLYGAPADMRKSFDGLSALTKHGLGEDPLSGSLFVFINRRGSQIKVLYFRPPWMAEVRKTQEQFSATAAVIVCGASGWNGGASRSAT